jgi:hypothetical protein
MRDAWSAFRRNWWRLVFASVGAVAAVVSYGHIVSLFLAWHQTTTDAHLMPIAIDGLIIIGAGAAKSGQAWLGWSAIGPGLAASLYANVMNGLPHGLGAAMGSGWATIALFLATNVMERWKPAQVDRGGQGGQGVGISTASEPEIVDDSSVIPATPATCGHEVAGTVEELVRNAYLHGRDCLGDTPSQRSLAATYGVHRTKVAALVGHLNGTGGLHAADQH